MSKKLLAVVLLSLTLAACEPGTTENNSNGNTNAKPDTPAASTPVSPSPEASPAAKLQLKAGDKVKVKINGVATEATVVSVDEKSSKLIVKVQGQKEDKTVAIADVIKE